MTTNDTIVRNADSVVTDNQEAESGRGDDPSGVKSGDSAAADDGKESRDRSPRRLSISLSARGLLLAVVIVGLVAAGATFGFLYFGARQQLDAQHRTAIDNAHAEKIALDYAVQAATMNFQDLNAWKVKLVAGTAPELNDKLTKAASSMEQILVPLQWNSTSQPLAAKVRSVTNGIYVVDCFVSVQTKTVQAPDPLGSTATYSLTIDSTKNWQITDIGGIGSVLGQN
jgi:hypothetical protein